MRLQPSLISSTKRNAAYAADTEFDRQHLWHPYESAQAAELRPLVVAAEGVYLQLADGRQLIDGMASWWSAIHGYNQPRLNAAVSTQLQQMSHVMFGGLAHPPAVALGQLLLELAPGHFDQVFYSDSGSVAVEVALKMALQYWRGRGQPERQRFLALRGGYHGDTFGAMSVCDPVTGMHQLFRGGMPKQYFVPRPSVPFGTDCDERELEPVARSLKRHGQHIAALIVEPIVQGAGGMWFYSADYLRRLRELCDTADVLLIADEIATGFGRTGRMFACEHAALQADVLCLGKALTGGYMSLGATLCSATVAAGVNASEARALLHGPTFMANPLACAVAAESVRLLLESPWSERVMAIEAGFKSSLEVARSLPGVADVRCLGAIAVIELREPPADPALLQRRLLDRGVWLRPFGRLIYAMPPYTIERSELEQLASAMVEAAR